MGAPHLNLDSEKRKIIHVDMDCFFAAVEELDNPSLKGKAVAVGGSPSGRGVLCTANYEARKFGVRSAMSSAHALKKCPHLIFIRPRSSRYKEFALKIREIFSRYTDLIEPLSLDEAYLDVTHCERHQGSATLIAQEIKDTIFKETGLTASAGVAPNKFLAKVASDWKKPNGLFTVSPDQAKDFAMNLSLKKVPGVGDVTFRKCVALGLHTLKDIQEKPIGWLEIKLGKLGPSLLRKSFGIDNRPVSTGRPAKSISTEETYNKDLETFSEIEERIPFLAEEALERLSRHLKKKSDCPSPHKIFIKIKTCQFNSHTHEGILRHLDVHLNEETLRNTPHLYQNLIAKVVTPMYKELYDQCAQTPLRLLGLGFRLNVSSSYELERLGQLRLL